MAAGKTTAGKEIAEFFGCFFIDCDEEIVRRTNKTIPEIFAEIKESGFRKKESEVFADILRHSPSDSIIASGGGLLLNEQNRKLIGDQKIVFLDTDFVKIMERLSLRPEERPLVIGKSSEEISRLFVERRKKYLEYADFVVKNTDEIKDLFHSLKMQE